MGLWEKFAPVRNHRDRLLAFVLSIACIALIFAPSGIEQDTQPDKEYIKAHVIAVDNELVETFGVVNQGDQKITLEITSGQYSGKTVTAYNTLMGDPELDWLFSPGEDALVSVYKDGDEPSVDVLGPYRLDTQGYLTAIFFILLIAVAGWVGAKAILSFVFSILLIWKALIPLCIAGWDPIPLSLAIVAILTGAITLLVGGFGKKGLTAFLGGFLGLLTTCGLAMFFVPKFYLVGTTKPFAKMLLFTNPHLDLYRFFISGIFIASSGAVMDLAMDIAAAMEEIKQHHPEITRRKLFISGIKVGRAVVGTMTTTLLLAYSGGYLMLLLHFMSQGIPVKVMLNSTFVSSEVLNTLVGSFGLVTVAPFAALVGSLLFTIPSKTNTNLPPAAAV